MSTNNTDSKILLDVRDIARDFDVSKPWLNRVIEKQPKQSSKPSMASPSPSIAAKRWRWWVNPAAANPPSHA